jgi:hypothetical protein
MLSSVSSKRDLSHLILSMNISLSSVSRHEQSLPTDLCESSTVVKSCNNLLILC